MIVYLRARLRGYRRGLRRGRLEGITLDRIYVKWDDGGTSALSSWRNLLVVYS